MSYTRPGSVGELLRSRAEHPDWTLLAGGTDVMVGVNLAGARPSGVIDLAHIPDLARWSVADGWLCIGACVTFGVIETRLAELVPGLAAAARTVGSPQIRAVATLGGNLGTASPAGDAHPVLIAADARVELRSATSSRSVPVTDLFEGPGRTIAAPDEVVTEVRIPVGGDTSQRFAKIGTRNAMVISVASLGLVLDRTRRRVGVGLGSVGPTPIRARAAEEYLAERLWERAGAPGDAELREFAALAAEAARPIDDVRGTAAYRTHVVAVLARRCAARAIEEGNTR